MKRKTFLFWGIIFSFILINAATVFCQDENAGMPAPNQAAPAEPDMQWLWGEVVSVDAAAGRVVIKYLDYETDTEKEIAIDVDDKTAFENINSLGGIKPVDILSIDYVTSPEGKNTARNISLEKPESAETLPGDIAPAASQTTQAPKQ